ncbi:MAG: hypothetical protein IIV24_04010, partial [Alistipes sp.]|nr:hypothetical protein [Alistipes sp.]
VEEVDETKEPGFRQKKQDPYTGAKVEAYQKVYDGSGNNLARANNANTWHLGVRVCLGLSLHRYSFSDFSGGVVPSPRRHNARRE